MTDHDGGRAAEFVIPVQDMIHRMDPSRLRSIISIKGRPVKNVDLPIVIGD